MSLSCAAHRIHLHATVTGDAKKMWWHSSRDRRWIFKVLQFHPKSIYNNTTSSFKNSFRALEVHAMSSNVSRCCSDASESEPPNNIQVIIVEPTLFTNPVPSSAEGSRPVRGQNAWVKNKRSLKNFGWTPVMHKEGEAEKRRNVISRVRIKVEAEVSEIDLRFQTEGCTLEQGGGRDTLGHRFRWSLPPGRGIDWDEANNEFFGYIQLLNNRHLDLEENESSRSLLDTERKVHLGFGDQYKTPVRTIYAGIRFSVRLRTTASAAKPQTR
ncbi:hypothetical protein DFH08DRAFT_811060 [Mycena albidolilacea]|uniref:Uncharacterized protein n=1 Tax=Mycena albidolilacea TaxID=1033008 RepID=A0AAD7EN82_9AGAR|nr:hypothetical protein DFH08DRAFT_811060 [Mycena albidolilacea]